MTEQNFKTPIPADFHKELESLLHSTDEAESLCNALDGISPVAIRLNRNKLSLLPYNTTSRVPWCDEGFYLSDRPLFTLNPLLHAGGFYVQEAASMIHSRLTRYAAEILGSKPLKVIDFCAAPGGKTTAVINSLPLGSVVIANEFSPQRASVLKENLIKYGSPDTSITNSDACKFEYMPPLADLIILDAPCSGEGMMRKEETARSQWNEGLIHSCAALQRDLIEAAINALAPGGILIYSTCTFNRRENEENVAYMLDKGLNPISIDISEFSGLRHGISDNDDLNGCSVRFFPHLVETEGLFVAMLRKPYDEVTEQSLPKKKFHKAEKEKNDIKGIIDKVSGWLENPSRFEIRIIKDNIFAIPYNLLDFTVHLPSDIKISSQGVRLGQIKGKDIIPAHELALSSALNPQAFPSVELDEKTALTYLRRETILLPEGTPKGFVIVSYNDLPLGFVKNIGNRANNLYPAEYRIRMQLKE